jgi:putative flippase GtrA
LNNNANIRYLLAGGWNTVFGYSAGMLIYNFLSATTHILLIGIFTNLLTITMSFLTYKFFVFRSKNQWFKEYLKSFLVYGISAIFGILALWIMVDYLSIAFWFSQAIIVILTIIFSYLSHKNFTFKS